MPVCTRSSLVQSALYSRLNIRAEHYDRVHMYIHKIGWTNHLNIRLKGSNKPVTFLELFSSQHSPGQVPFLPYVRPSASPLAGWQCWIPHSAVTEAIGYQHVDHRQSEQMVKSVQYTCTFTEYS